MSALVVLFVDIIQHPRSETAPQDLHAMLGHITMSSSLINNEDNNYVRSTVKVMAELHRLACVAVDKATRRFVDRRVAPSTENAGTSSAMPVDQMVLSGITNCGDSTADHGLHGIPEYGTQVSTFIFTLYCQVMSLLG